MAIICVGYLTDPHIPFHSRRGLSAALNCLADSNLAGLILGGDILDMYWCHGHGSKHPTAMNLSSFEKEREAGNDFLDTLDKTWPTIPKHFIEGNHETRFERWIVDHAPQLFGVTEMRLMLGMDKRSNWSYHDYGPRQLVRVMKTNLFTKHAPKGASAKAILDKAACNLIFGHVHRYMNERKVTADGRTLVAHTPGWLGDKKFDKVFGYVQGHHDWSMGFSRIWIDTDNWSWWIEAVEILDGKSCIAGGKRYVG